MSKEIVKLRAKTRVQHYNINRGEFFGESPEKAARLVALGLAEFVDPPVAEKSATKQEVALESDTGYATKVDAPAPRKRATTRIK